MRFKIKYFDLLRNRVDNQTTLKIILVLSKLKA